MSYFVGDDGKDYDLFGRGGIEDLAASMNRPFLGALPIHMKMREHADAGKPLENWTINDDITERLDHLCRSVAQQVSIKAMSGDYVQPTLSVS
jgi:ATP-binding protein involved in chromosome partitioning